MLIVHHSGVDASRPRGHTSLAGAVDVQISVKKDAAGNPVATVDLSKDFEAGRQFASRLVSVDLGLDDLGEPISSCVLEPVQADTAEPATKARPARTKALSRPAAALHGAFLEAVGAHGQSVKVLGDGPAVKAVSLADLREEFRRRYATGETDEKKAGATIRKAFQRALEQAEDAGLKSGSWGGAEWLWKL